MATECSPIMFLLQRVEDRDGLVEWLEPIFHSFIPVCFAIRRTMQMLEKFLQVDLANFLLFVHQKCIFTMRVIYCFEN